ncbi:RNA-directed DNA polymerase from mobile element jockey [Plakobranchus ocellatus]|uniref:RNA-directed DNA polymerase from mobile element jockey n=1 Tax=Plakobranchus ocellatus TaxID=259542 RepID=A0AAV3ZZF5_9GAST|nr:RNA-directed DNA polymerase from mobile element jockey [Plakobranchus ocellatus]
MKQSWKTYVSSLNSNTSSKTVWKKIRKIKGNDCAPSCHLKKDGQIISNLKDHADHLAETFSKNSSSENYSKNFQQTKQRAEKQNLNFSSENNEPYNNPFLMAELKNSIIKSNESAAGPDGVYYQFLRHLPESCLHTFLKLFNNIWTTRDIPPSWREASVVPIPKPGKDPSDPSNYRPIALVQRIYTERALHLDGQPISVKGEAKFLGVFFDSKLNFSSHVKYLKKKCLKALNLLHVVGHTDWGADRATLLRLYRTLVRSKLDYGSVIYGSAKKHVLRALDPIHHQGLRIALGAFRTTPIKSLYASIGVSS